MSIIDDIKNDVKKSGSNKKKIVYFKPGLKVRVRFLQEMDDGMKIHFHDSFDQGVNYPCQELFDRECSRHDDESLRHRDNYCWSVWNHDAKEVQLLLGPVNNYSPIPALLGNYDVHGTIKDRDYVITKTGKGTEQTWAVVAMDKVKFKNEKAKPYSESKVLAILDKAYPCDDEEEEEVPKKKKKHKDEDDELAFRRKKKVHDDDYDDDEDDAPKKKKKKPVDEDDDDDFEEDEKPKKKSKKEEPDYEDMTARELYLLCVEREIKAKQKMDEEYYIEKLEAFDE
jgi:hypothetical protein